MLARHTEIVTQRYALEPGDGTHYEFSISPCANHLGTIQGAGDGARYHTLTLHNPGFGTYEISEAAIRHPHLPFVLYLESHFKAITYTLAAVVLAASVLIEDPDNLEGACKAMLRASDLLTEKGS